MDEFDFEKIKLTANDIECIRKAAKHPDKLCIDPSQRLIDSKLLVNNSVYGVKNYGVGYIIEKRYNVGENALNYLAWMKRKRRSDTWNSVKEWIPIVISILALFVSIFLR